jgi:hypothetical protein
MAISEKVIEAERCGDDVMLHTKHVDLKDATAKRIIRNATIEPKEGDYLHFGSAGTVHNGEVFGGQGFIAMDGNEFPYRRISAIELVQDW